MASVQERLEQLLEPVIGSLGYELLLLEYSPSPKNAMLRLYIDAASGITLEDCVRVSKEVAGVMEARTSVVYGKGVSVREAIGGRRIIKNKTKPNPYHIQTQY